MARIKFEFDPDFEDNVKKASNKSNSSLRPLADTIRNVTDQIYFHAYNNLKKYAGEAEAEVQAAKGDRHKPNGRRRWLEAKAKAAAIRSGRNTIAPTMEYDGDEIYGMVAIYRKNSYVLEYGGIDEVGEIGKGTGEYISHPPYAFLRRAIDGVRE